MNVNIRYTYEEVKNNVNNSGYELLSNEYLNNRQKITIKDTQGFIACIQYSSFLAGHFPYKFYKSNPYVIQNIKLWLKLNNKSFTIISSVYEGCSKKLKWKCLKPECGEIFNSDWQKIEAGNGCPFCSGYQVGLSNCLATKNSELASEWHPTLNGDLTSYDVTCGSHKKVWWICKECGNEWKAIVASRNNKRGCPECSKSHGEKRVKEFLISKNFIEINQNEYNKLLIKNNNYFIPQKTFKELLGIGGGLLSYDFYLPKYNLLIEYQGRFHDGSGSEYTKLNLEKQKEHDRRKKNYALSNGYNFLEIWYWDYDNIETILTDYLKELDNGSFLVCKKEVI